MMLSREEKTSFVRDGFIVLKKHLGIDAIRPILVRHEELLSEGLKQGVQTETGGTAVSNGDELNDLFQQPPLQKLIDQFLDASCDITSQLVIWHPQTMPHFPYGLVHVDRPIGKFGLGSSLPFDLAIGVMLQGEKLSQTGNLGVYPGTHRAFEDYFNKFPERNFWNGIPEIPMPLVHEVLIEPGDVVVFQSQLGHTSMPHRGKIPKLAAYFKLSHPSRKDRGAKALRDIWGGYRSEYRELDAELKSGNS